MTENNNENLLKTNTEDCNIESWLLNIDIDIEIENNFGSEIEKFHFIQNIRTNLKNFLYIIYIIDIIDIRI